jgi:hypothetical protein
MKITTCFEQEIAGFKITLKQKRDGSFTVTYGKQVFKGLGYQKASQELGGCIMHALACESLLDNEVR